MKSNVKKIEIMYNLKRIELACLYISHKLAFIDSNDLRMSNCDRSISVTKMLERSGFDLKNRFVIFFLKKYSKLDLVWLDKYYKENLNLIKKVIKGNNYYPTNITCCASCHMGSSDTSKYVITQQRNIYNGEFICKGCENNIKNIELLSKQNLFNGLGLYKDEGMRMKGSKLLGFGGRCFIIKKKNGDIILTNNLFQKISIHKCFYDKIKNHVNCEIFSIYNFKDENIESILTKKEINSISNQLKKCVDKGLR